MAKTDDLKLQKAFDTLTREIEEDKNPEERAVGHAILTIIRSVVMDLRTLVKTEENRVDR